MHQGPELSIIWIVCFTLATGAALRPLCQKTGIPYTIAMLILGILTGIAARSFGEVSTSLAWLGMLGEGSTLSPELILFVFLPALVFESAFSIEVFAFRKNVGTVLLLAGPALLVSTLVVAAGMQLITSSNWQWSLMACLLFGALISATDPVAVVALLKDLGAPKRLSLLIEGESLLNDGTAIVAFTVLLKMLTGEGEAGVLSTTIELIYVTGGGICVGLILGFGISHWIARIFNNPLVEITLTIVLAYLAMLIAEAGLHVSGVMAVVTAGLWMSGPGRTHVSPEIMPFLHRFWEMLSYLFNTLIFFLVGLVIATQVQAVTWTSITVIILAYLFVVVSRFAIVYATLPAANRVSEAISRSAGLVMAWGGLRGAVSLSLGLIVSQHPDLPQTLRNQILAVTAGVVLLTILINGSTMAWLLKRMGFDKPPAGDRLAQLSATASALDSVARRIDEVALSRDLRTVNWLRVKQDLSEQQESLRKEIEETRAELSTEDPAERTCGFWRQVLNVERGAYWAAFSQGTLSGRAARILDHDVDLQIDRLRRGSLSKERDQHIRDWRTGPSRWLQPGSKLVGKLQFEMLALRYDLWRGESLAADRVLHELEELSELDAETKEEIAASYRAFRNECKRHLEEMRSNLPEVTQAIETQLARRIQLNFERDRYVQLAKLGMLTREIAGNVLESVEQRMKGLQHAHRALELPRTADLCRTAPLFATFDAETIQALADLMHERMLSPGEVLFRQGEKGESMFIIARGAVEVIREADGESEVLDVLGGGDILGEMALLTQSPRSATIKATTTVTLGEIRRDGFQRLMQTQPKLRQGVWETFARRKFIDHLRQESRYRSLTNDLRERWFDSGHVFQLQENQTLPGDQEGFLFLICGQLKCDEEQHQAFTLIPLKAIQTIRAVDASWVAQLPPSWIECLDPGTDKEAIELSQTTTHTELQL